MMIQESVILPAIKRLIPVLSSNGHKGTSGRIGIIGGCAEYTGAPYFAAITSLRLGGDLSYVFCTPEAATPIKCYSPDLVVLPHLTDHSSLFAGLEKVHSLVIGPGLGRDEMHRQTIKLILSKVDKPIIIDADGLFFLDPSFLVSLKEKSHPRLKVTLTPNVMEFDRLFKATFPQDLALNNQMQENVSKLASHLGVNVLLKGAEDIISDGHRTICSSIGTGSHRRCGGQGDVLAGSIGYFNFLSHSQSGENIPLGDGTSMSHGMIASLAGSIITKRCNLLTYQVKGRSMITSDMIQSIEPALEFILSS